MRAESGHGDWRNVFDRGQLRRRDGRLPSAGPARSGGGLFPGRARSHLLLHECDHDVGPLEVAHEARTFGGDAAVFEVHFAPGPGGHGKRIILPQAKKPMETRLDWTDRS